MSEPGFRSNAPVFSIEDETDEDLVRSIAQGLVRSAMVQGERYLARGANTSPSGMDPGCCHSSILIS